MQTEPGKRLHVLHRLGIFIQDSPQPCSQHLMQAQEVTLFSRGAHHSALMQGC